MKVGFKMNNEEYNNKLDLVRNIFVAGTGMIPVAGGTISVLLDKYLPSAVEKRREKFLNKLENDFKMLPNEILAGLEYNQAFYSIFLKVLSVVTYEHETEKINIFRNILINSTVLIEQKFNEVEFFVKLINSLTIDQIRILHLFYLRDNLKKIDFENINTFIDTQWNIDKSYRWSIITELIRDGLISSSIERQRSKGSGHQLSTFGEDFIKYIFSPIDIED